jgi:hypothetical protein
VSELRVLAPVKLSLKNTVAVAHNGAIAINIAVRRNETDIFFIV